MQPIILYYQPYSSFRWLPHDFDDRSKSKRNRHGCTHAFKGNRAFAFRNKWARLVHNFLVELFGVDSRVRFESNLRMVKRTLLIGWTVDGITRSSDPISGEKSITPIRLGFATGNLSHTRCLCSIISPSPSLSLSLLTRDLIGFTIVRIVFPFPFLSFFFFIPFFFTPLSVLVFALLFGFSLVSFFFFFNPAAN